MASVKKVINVEDFDNSLGAENEIYLNITPQICLETFQISFHNILASSISLRNAES